MELITAANRIGPGEDSCGTPDEVLKNDDFSSDSLITASFLPGKNE